MGELFSHDLGADQSHPEKGEAMGPVSLCGLYLQMNRVRVIMKKPMGFLRTSTISGGFFLGGPGSLLLRYSHNH